MLQVPYEYLYQYSYRTTGTSTSIAVRVLYCNYCSKTQAGGGRTRTGRHTLTHRTRTGAEQNSATAQSPTPARTEAKAHPGRARINRPGTRQPAGITRGPETTNPGTRQSQPAGATRGPHLDPPAPGTGGHLSQKKKTRTATVRLYWYCTVLRVYDTVVLVQL